MCLNALQLKGWLFEGTVQIFILPQFELRRNLWEETPTYGKEKKVTLLS